MALKIIDKKDALSLDDKELSVLQHLNYQEAMREFARSVVILSRWLNNGKVLLDENSKAGLTTRYADNFQLLDTWGHYTRVSKFRGIGPAIKSVRALYDKLKQLKPELESFESMIEAIDIEDLQDGFRKRTNSLEIFGFPKVTVGSRNGQKLKYRLNNISDTRWTGAKRNVKEHNPKFRKLFKLAKNRVSNRFNFKHQEIPDDIPFRRIDPETPDLEDLMEYLFFIRIDLIPGLIEAAGHYLTTASDIHTSRLAEQEAVMTQINHVYDDEAVNVDPRINKTCSDSVKEIVKDLDDLFKKNAQIEQGLTQLIRICEELGPLVSKLIAYQQEKDERSELDKEIGYVDTSMTDNILDELQLATRLLGPAVEDANNVTVRVIELRSRFEECLDKVIELFREE